MNAVTYHLKTTPTPKRRVTIKPTKLAVALAKNVGYDRAPEGITTETWLTPPKLIHAPTNATRIDTGTAIASTHAAITSTENLSMPETITD